MVEHQLATFTPGALNGAAILSISGEVDLSNRDHLELALHRSLAQHSKSFIANLVDLTYADSACVHALFRAQRSAKGMNKPFTIVIKTGGGLHKILQIAGLLQTFDIRYC